MYTVSPSLPGVGPLEVPSAADFLHPTGVFICSWNSHSLPISVRPWGVGDKNGAVISIKGISFTGALQSRLFAACILWLYSMLQLFRAKSKCYIEMVGKGVEREKQAHFSARCSFPGSTEDLCGILGLPMSHSLQFEMVFRFQLDSMNTISWAHGRMQDGCLPVSDT